MNGYQKLREIADRGKINASDLIVMGSSNDPYYVGTDNQVRFAEWFARYWNDPEWNVEHKHMRGLHYRLQSFGNIKLPRKVKITDKDSNGNVVRTYYTDVYLNKLGCWKFLTEPAKHARILGLVDPHEFVDRRNASVYWHASGLHDDGFEHEFSDGMWTIHKINPHVYGSSMHMPSLDITGHGYQSGMQKYLLVLFVEKSTMNEIIKPICSEFNVIFVEGKGYTSITRILELLRHAEQTGKPVRIFYLSDYDLAGKCMPLSTSRQLQWWTDVEFDDVDVKLTQIGLTQEQVEQFALPKSPDKEDVELDALEALHPGELRNIVRQAIQPYYDNELPDKRGDYVNDSIIDAEDQWEEYTSEFVEEKNDLSKRITKVFDQYRDELFDLEARINKDIEPLENELKELNKNLQTLKEEFHPEYLDPPEAEPEEQDESDWLYSSDRDYFTQLLKFKEAKGK